MKQDMLIKDLQIKLILLFTITTCSVLAAVLLSVWRITQEQWESDKERQFETNFLSACDLVRNSNSISHTEIATLEIGGQAAVLVEDNGTALNYTGAYYTKTSREVLFGKLKSKLKESGQDFESRTLTVKENASSMYEIEGQYGERYFGAAFVVNVKGGYRSIFMLGEKEDKSGSRAKQGRLILVVGAAGGILLFLLSNFLIRRVLKPVEDSRKNQSEFIAAVSHELRSPLAVIRANTAALTSMKENDSSKDMFLSFARGIDKECVRMAGLIEDMMFLTFADAGTWKMDMQEVDLDTLLIETYDFFYPYCQEKNRRLKLEDNGLALPQVKGDKERLRQILFIFIHNAVSYSKDGDLIVLRGFTDKKQAVLQVEDHGIGIEDEKKKEIFKRFYRGDKSRKDKTHFGLGLSIAMELIQLHGGSITVTDTLGGGSTFSISLKII